MMKTALQISCTAATSGEGFVSGHGSAVRRKRRVADHGLEEEDLGEVSGYSTVCTKPAREAACSQRPRRLIPMPSVPRHSIRCHLKMRSDRPPRFRKACNLPVLPRLPTASCHSARVPISSATSENRNRSAARRAPQPVVRTQRSLCLASSFCRDRRSRAYFPCLTTTRPCDLVREISTQNRRAHIAMSFNPAITWRPL